MNLWQGLLKISLWLASIGLMVASSGLDGAYLSKLMPPGWAWVGLVLNAVADVTSELGMYWYGRLQMDRSVVKQRRAKWLLVGEGVLVGYAWLFSWRQLVPIIAKVDPNARWMAPVAAAFIPSALIVVGYVQALLAGRIEAEKTSAQAEPGDAPVAPVKAPLRADGAPVAQPVARIDDFRAIVAGMNGERASLDADRLAAKLRERGLALPSASTVRRWLSDVTQ